MRIGIPREIKIHEGRIALVPAAAAELVEQGHQVYIEQNAAALSGYQDSDYTKRGIQICTSADDLYESVELIVKVKEPLPIEYARLRSDQLLFSYLHLAAAPELMNALCNIGLTAVAFETVATQSGLLPLLAPMSDIAGRLSVQIGSNLLHQYNGGRGVLLGGLAATERGKVVVLGAGVAGGNAVRMAAAIGSEVVVFDKDRQRLEAMREIGDNVTSLHPFADSIRESVQQADLVIGAVLVTGAKAPHLVDSETVKGMKAGSVLVDISVDQGGCIETTRPTNYENPTFVWENVIHFGVTNMPGAVPRTASQALSAALVPYILRLATTNWRKDPELAAGINVSDGEIVHPALKKMD